MSGFNENNVKRALELSLDVSFATKDMAMLKLALDKGADAQAALKQGHQSYSWEIVDLALAAGADLNASVSGATEGDTYFIDAVRLNRLEQAEGYLDRGAEPNHTFGKESALEILLANIKERKSRGFEVTTGQQKLSMRLLAALSNPHHQHVITLQKKVILQAPQQVFKVASSKPKDINP